MAVKRETAKKGKISFEGERTYVSIPVSNKSVVPLLIEAGMVLRIFEMSVIVQFLQAYIDQVVLSIAWSCRSRNAMHLSLSFPSETCRPLMRPSRSNYLGSSIVQQSVFVGKPLFGG